MVRRNRHSSALMAREHMEYEKEVKERLKEKKQLSERKRRKPISVQVQILTGRRIHLFVDSRYDTLHDIKKKIQSKEGIHPDQQILFLNGIRLRDGTTRELHIKEGACLFLTLRNRGG